MDLSSNSSNTIGDVMFDINSLSPTCNLQSLPRWGRSGISKLCGQCNISIDCQTAFDNGDVTTFGGVKRGNMAADVDVAGLGVRAVPHLSVRLDKIKC